MQRINSQFLILLILILILLLGLSSCGEEKNPTVPVVVVTHAVFTPTVTPQPLTPLPTLVFATPTLIPISSPTPFPTPTYRPTSTPETKPLPTPPPFTIAKPDQLANSIAAWLNKQPDALPSKDPAIAKNRLRDLLLNWNAIGLNSAVEAADLDGDGQPELVATVAESWSEVPTIQRDAGFLLLLKGNKNQWSASFLRSRTLKLDAEEDFLHPQLEKIIDLTGDKLPDIVFSELICGSNTCILRLHAVSWNNGKFTDLTPDVPSMPTAQLSIEQNPVVGTLPALILIGGTINSPSAGLQRTRSEYWRWDAASKSVKLAETRFATSFFLYHRVLDGNAALDKGDLNQAIDLYYGSLTDSTLKLWFVESQGTSEDAIQEREVLTAFARFRLGIAYGLKGDLERAKTVMEEASLKDGNYAGWAKAFNIAVSSGKFPSTTAAIAEGCATAINYSQQNRSLIEAMNRFGSANPVFKPENICPKL
ncbi:MAG: hypothetical protein HXX08_04435 [Chloroflexi bacterium]|uniref:Tetratricopeptide repeat protein n=1 Tax=Candidatus Chlorohelix allophototropha TaxID=3003348 RepID=A0A8T7LSV4_9CHLR|nr:hypothetical protein [Chloroflexota bacterium]WJW66987.1 hypothetical protein OZ401_000235 [Chloroflexota bacterium L227-S17]